MGGNRLFKKARKESSMARLFFGIGERQIRRHDTPSSATDWDRGNRDTEYLATRAQPRRRGLLYPWDTSRGLLYEARDDGKNSNRSVSLVHDQDNRLVCVHYRSEVIGCRTVIISVEQYGAEGT